jgi:uncharacterized membrane protein
MTEASEQSVIATFDSTEMAEQAARDLMGWDDANNDIKLGAIGLLSKDQHGEVKTRNMSPRHTETGAKIGMTLGFVAAVVSGGLTLVPGAVGGAVAGGAVGALSRKRLRAADKELQELGHELDGGRVALMVMCNEAEVQATAEYLVAAGGEVQSYSVSEEDLRTGADAATTPATASSGSPERPAPATEAPSDTSAPAAPETTN